MDGFYDFLATHDTGVSGLLIYLWNLRSTTHVEWNDNLRLIVNFPTTVVGAIAIFWLIRGLKKNFIDDPKTNGGDYSFSKEDWFNIGGSAVMVLFIFGPTLLTTVIGPLIKRMIG